MKRSILIFSFVLLASCGAMAQKQDSVPVKSLAEKGAQSDILFGNQAKKKQLLDTPQKLQMPDSSQTKDIQSKKKKPKHRKI
jgi:hypothetical protein